ncbi:MAG: NAD(P)H-dependent oxidoreductase subunit E [Saprospiraceae bacterium]|nr:NAD(P)H-dependent oxidoreductase subunit E [Saprospiraceae bacterium]
MSKNLTALAGRKGKGLTNNLFERIANLAEESGTPDNEALKNIAEEFLIGNANVYGTATFYDFTKPENQGKKVYVCNGSACMLAGTQEAVKSELRKHFKEEEIGDMCCLGRCHENSAFHINGENYSAKQSAEIAHVIDGKLTDGKDNYHIGALGTPILTAPFPNLDECKHQIANMFKEGQNALLQAIKESGLRGRGGAGFPMAFKLDACRKAAGEPKFIVCNADEGDPGAFSDRYLMEYQPFAVLLGMLIAGYAAGAERGVIYIRAEYPESIAIIQDAIERLTEYGLNGHHILNSNFNFHFKLIKAQGAYICGEETALLQSIEGKRPEVRVRPPYPAQEGLFGKPTVVNNVETLANLYDVLVKSGQAFAKIGTQRSTGTKLLSLDSSFNRPGLYEVDMGTPLAKVVETLGGGFRKPVKALHIGGPLGGLVPMHKIPDLTVDFESFAENGFLLGHASIIGIPEDYPMVKYLEHLFEFTAHESCGKCFPCRIGSVRGQELLHKAQHESYKINTELFNDLVETLAKGSLCALGGGIPLPIRNAMQYFKDELSPYFE